MGIIINKKHVSSDIAQKIINLCPFGAIEYQDGELSVNAACKSCRLCVKKGPQDIMCWQDDVAKSSLDKSLWRGIAVFAQCQSGHLHPVTPELVGKARELAAVIGEKVLAVIIGKDVKGISPEEVPACIFGYTILNDFSARNRSWNFRVAYLF